MRREATAILPLGLLIYALLTLGNVLGSRSGRPQWGITRFAPILISATIVTSVAAVGGQWQLAFLLVLPIALLQLAALALFSNRTR